MVETDEDVDEKDGLSVVVRAWDDKEDDEEEDEEDEDEDEDEEEDEEDKAE
jgi:hypothetical protein